MLTTTRERRPSRRPCRHCRGLTANRGRACTRCLAAPPAADVPDLRVGHDLMPSDASGVTYAVVADLVNEWGDGLPWKVSLHASAAKARRAARRRPPWVPKGAAVRVEAWWRAGEQGVASRVVWGRTTPGVTEDE